MFAAVLKAALVCVLWTNGLWPVTGPWILPPCC